MAASNNYNLRAFRLLPKFVERIWGKTDLTPWYESTGAGEGTKIGEVWLTGPECVIEGGGEDGRTLGDLAAQCVGTLDGVVPGEGYPLLVKMLFPDEKLSVQVHPDDVQAKTMGLSRGKTECWYVLEAVPGATVMCGLKPGVGLGDLRDGARDGTLETMLNEVPVKAGDMVLVEAGTVHAIGPGVVLLEVQQTCDVTYRLFDYGRGRDLHLEDGLKVVKFKTKSGTFESIESEKFKRLVKTKYFVVDRFEVPAGNTFEMHMDGVGCVVGLSGKLAANEVRFGMGEAVVVPTGSVTMSSVEGGVFVRCFEPVE